MSVDLNVAEMEQAQRAVHIDLEPVRIEVEGEFTTNFNHFGDNEFAAEQKFETRAGSERHRVHMQCSVRVAHESAGRRIDLERFNISLARGRIDFEEEFSINLQAGNTIGGKRQINAPGDALAIDDQINRAGKRAEE